MSITLQIPDDLHRELHSIAEEAGETDEDIILKALREYIERESHRQAVMAEELIDDASFEALTRGVVRDYREVLERLA